MNKLMNHLPSKTIGLVIISGIFYTSTYARLPEKGTQQYYLSPDKPFNFDSWKLACDKLPAVTGVKDDIIKQHSLPITISLEEFTYTLNKFVDDTIENQITQETCLDSDGQLSKLIDKESLELTPYVQKNVITHDEGIVHVCGDIHGDIHALNAYFSSLIEKGIINKQLMINPELVDTVRFVFLGDHVDCAQYCVEVLYLLATFKNNNPNQVIWQRGNHESQASNENSAVPFYVLSQEIEAKYGNGPEIKALKKLLYKSYECLPVAAYIGIFNKARNCIDYAIFSHASLEFGYCPTALLKTRQVSFAMLPRHLDRQETFKKMCMSIKQIMKEDGYNNFEPVVAAFLQFIEDKGNFINSWQLLDDIGFVKGDFRIEPEIFTIGQRSDHLVELITITNKYWCIGTAGKILLQSFIRYNNDTCLREPDDNGIVHRLCISFSAHQHVSNVMHKQPNGTINLCEAPLFSELLKQQDGIVRLWQPKDYQNALQNRVWPEEFVKLWSATPPHDFFNKSIAGHQWQKIAIAQLHVTSKGYDQWTLDTMQISSEAIYPACV